MFFWFIKFILLLLNILLFFFVFIFMFEEQMSHDSRRELYEIFRLNYTKLNIILKKDGAYNGEKCPRRRANNSQQPTSNNTAGTNDRPNVTRTNLQRTNIEIARPIRKRTRSERNATAGNERVAVNKIHVACQWESSAHGYVWVLVWLRVTGGVCCLPVFVRSVRFGVRLATRWPLVSRASNMCACLCMVRCQTKTSTKTPTNRSEGHTKTRMLYESNKHWSTYRE